MLKTSATSLLRKNVVKMFGTSLKDGFYLQFLDL
jgi:hypothetical protein